VSGLANALAEEGIGAVIWAQDGSATTTPLLSKDSKVVRIGGALSDALSAVRPMDIIHDNGIWLPHNHRIAAFAHDRGIPRIVSTRGMLEPWAMSHKGWKKRIAWTAYQRRDLTRAAALHATAPTEAANLNTLGLGCPVSTIPNGIDVPQLPARDARGGSSEMRTALFVGRLYPVKGLPMLIDAWSRVRPHGWKLDIVGPDEAHHKTILEAAIAEAGLQQIVRFLGPLTGAKKHSAFCAADLFVLPSHSESFGIAAAEALAYGLPVLTTTAVPWPQLEAQGCGWRVAPSTDGLACGLRRALQIEGPVLRAMGMRGREYVAREFEWKPLAKRFIQLYLAAMSSGSRR
jgi:glycosyltransferase involved in cell wall biosynthesis